MDRESIKDFLKELTDNQNLYTEDRGDWVSLSCPLSFHTHPKGTDNRISFGVHVNDDGVSIFSCFSCHKKGNLKYLVELMEMYTGDSFLELKESVDEDSFISTKIPEWDKRIVSKNNFKQEPIDESIIDIYDDAEDHWYLEDRGISNKTAKLLNLRVDPDNHGVERILFPVYSLNGEFYGFTGRATDESVKLRVRDYLGLPKKYMLLGSHLINKTKDKYIIAVEGLFDYAKLREYGHPTVAIMQSTVTNYQADIFREIGLPIICMFDDDLAGKECQEHTKHILGKHLPISKVQYPKIKAGLDPCGLTREEAKQMIDNRRIL